MDRLARSAERAGVDCVEDCMLQSGSAMSWTELMENRILLGGRFCSGGGLGVVGRGGSSFGVEAADGLGSCGLLAMTSSFFQSEPNTCQSLTISSPLSPRGIFFQDSKGCNKSRDFLDSCLNPATVFGRNTCCEFAV